MREATSLFIGNIWSADYVDLQKVSKCKNDICFWLCVIDLFSEYASVIPLTNKRGIRITNVFWKTLDESIANQNKFG